MIPVKGIKRLIRILIKNPYLTAVLIPFVGLTGETILEML
jgi:hypothetical protein